MSNYPFSILYAQHRSKDGPTDASCAVPIEYFMACPESGLFYPAYDACVEVESSPCKDPRTFFCPACSSRLRINTPPKFPVAECRSCSWATGSDRFKALPDLLFCESNPFASQDITFETLLRAIQCGAEHETHVPTLDTRDQSSPVERGGFGTIVCDCCVSSTGENLRPEHEASDATLIFSGQVYTKNCLPTNDRFSARNWDSATMPPRRAPGSVLFTVLSPFDGKQFPPAETVREAAVKASVILPSFSVARHTSDFNRLVLSCRNVSGTLMYINLELISNRSRTGRSDPLHASWLGRHTAQLSALDGSCDFFLQVDGSNTKRLEIAAQVSFPQDAPGHECEPQQRRRDWRNQTWDCCLIISQL